MLQRLFYLLAMATPHPFWSLDSYEFPPLPSNPVLVFNNPPSSPVKDATVWDVNPLPPSILSPFPYGKEKKEEGGEEGMENEDREDEKEEEEGGEQREEKEEGDPMLVFPQMAFFQRRRKTLQGMTQLCNRDEIARAGFFKDGSWDLKCFCCGVILPFPQLHHNVFELHSDMSPDCIYAKMLA